MNEETTWYGRGWATFKGVPVLPPEDTETQKEWLEGAYACWCESPNYEECEKDELGYSNPDTSLSFQDELKRILTQAEEPELANKLIQLYEKS